MAAAWHLKDVVEATVNLLFVTTAAEVLRLEAGIGSGWRSEATEDVPAGVVKLARFVRYTPYPTLGALLSRLEYSILKQCNDCPQDGLVRELVALWEGHNGVGSELQRLKNWRNSFHGHGVLGDGARAAREVCGQLPRVVRVLDQLAPFNKRVHLECEELIEEDTLAPTHGGGLIPTGAPGLSLRPLVELMEFRGASGTRVALLDGVNPNRQSLRYRTPITGLSEYCPRGRLGSVELEAIEELARGAKTLVAPQDQEDEFIPLGWLEHVKSVRFADFDRASFTNPSYLVDAVESAIQESSKGALRIVGPAGSGKTFLTRVLVDRWRRQNPWLVLPYYAQPGVGTDVATFLEFMNAGCYESSMPLLEFGISLTKPSGQPDAADLFGWLAATRQESDLERVVVIIDGLDEIRPRTGRTTLADLLPGELPEGVVLLLLGREDEELDPDVRTTLAEVQWLPSSPIHIRTEPASEDAGPNTSLLHRHLSSRFGLGGEKNKERRQRLIEVGNGRFLHVVMLARGLVEGVFPKAELPDPGQVAVGYINGLLKKRQATQTYAAAIEQTVALLAAAYCPVPVECLIDWGIDPRHATEVFLDLSGLLSRRRSRVGDVVRGVREPYSYGIFHDSVRTQLRRDSKWGPLVAEAHLRIAERLMEDRAGDWANEEGVSWDRPEDAYAFLALTHHLVEVSEGDWPRLGADAAEVEAVLRRLVDRAWEVATWVGDPAESLFDSALLGSELHFRVWGDDDLRQRFDRALVMIRAKINLKWFAFDEAVSGAMHAVRLSKDLANRSGRGPVSLLVIADSLRFLGEVLLYSPSEGCTSEEHIVVGLQNLSERAAQCYISGVQTGRDAVVLSGRSPEILRQYSGILADAARVLPTWEGDEGEPLFLELAAIHRELFDLSDRSPEALRELASVLSEISGLLTQNEEDEEALKLCREVVRINQEAVDLSSRSSESLIGFVNSLLWLTEVRSMVEPYDQDEMLGSYRQVADVCREVLERSGQTEETLWGCAHRLETVADALLRNGERQKALECYSAIVGANRQLTDRFGRTPGNLAALSQALGAQAKALRDYGELDKAVEWSLEAEQLCREAVTGYELTGEDLRGLADALGISAGIHLDREEWAEALDKYREARQSFEKSLDGDLLEYDAEDFLEWLDMTSASLCVSASRWSEEPIAELLRGEALEHYRVAERVARERAQRLGWEDESLPTVSYILDEQAKVLLELGRVQEALGRYQESEVLREESVNGHGRTEEAINELASWSTKREGYSGSRGNTEKHLCATARQRVSPWKLSSVLGGLRTTSGSSRTRFVCRASPCSTWLGERKPSIAFEMRRSSNWSGLKLGGGRPKS